MSLHDHPRSGAHARMLFHATLVAGSFGLLQACSSDDATIMMSPGPRLAETENSPDQSVDELGPLYLIGHTVYSPDQANTYLSVVSSLAGDEEPDLSRSLEIGGAAVPYGIAGSRKVYVSSQEAGTMTEVIFDDDARPSMGRVVSFANQGINDTWGLNILLSPTKAYHISQSTFDVVVWNPEEMTVMGSFATGLGLDAAYDSRVFVRDPIFVGNQLVLVSGQWADYTPDNVTSVTVIDTVNDVVVSNETETRCYSLLAFAPDAEGNRYFISNGLGATGHLSTPDLVPPPCMIRMRAGETSFDRDWSRSLTADLGTSLWTGIAPGSEGKLFVQAIAQDAAAVLAATDALEMANVLGWTWYQLMNGDAAPTPIETPLTAAQNTTVMKVDAGSYMTSDEGTQSTLVETTFAEGPRPGVVVPGYIWNVLRIR
jgi:hypothetical protein